MDTLLDVGEDTIDTKKVDFITLLPLEISQYILCYLSRSVIDDCRLVSKSWNNFIKNNSKSLPKHQYKKIRISSRSVFKILVEERNKKFRQWNFEKKIISCNINKNSRKRKHTCERDLSKEYTVINKDGLKNVFNENNTTNSSEVLNDTFMYKINSSFWEEFITFLASQSSNESSNILPHSINQVLVKEKKRKDKIPCEKFFERLKKISQNSYIDTLELEEITLKDEMIDKIIESLKKATIGTLSVSFVKLTYCSPLKFLDLFDRLKLNVTQGYSVNWARMASNEHFSINNIIEKLCLNGRKINKRGTLQILDLGLLTDFNNDTIIINFNIKEIKLLLNIFNFLRIDGSSVNLDVLKELIMEWKFENNLTKTIYLSNCPLTNDLNIFPKIIEFCKEIGTSINKNGEMLTLKRNNKSFLTLKTVKHPNFGDQLQIVFH